MLSADIAIVVLLSGAALGQSAAALPAFEVADIHLSAPMRDPKMQGGVPRAGRFEIRRATMLDLIKTAYGVDADTVVGGPSWLEWDRFDLVAKAPPSTPPETVKPMLQALLADRFKLAVHKDTRPMQGFVLTVGKGQPKLKTADGSGEPGCELQPLPPPSPDHIPNATVSCRNMTMEAFAPMLRAYAGEYLNGPVLDSTGLKGAWDFDLTWSFFKGLIGAPGSDGVTIFDAVEKQLGLRLEPQKVPMPVLVVDRMNQKPTANPPGVAASLPALPSSEFEVASIRPSLPDALPGQFEVLPGGRIEARATPLLLWILQSWDTGGGPDEIIGAPKWLKPFEPAFDLIAKAPGTTIASGTEFYEDDYNAMLRALLADRFKMKAHFEDRPMDAYTLVAAKPKLKPADPSNRTGCKTERSDAPRDPGTGPPPIVATCRNVTMAQFADRLQSIAPRYLRYPALNASGIEGSWDFTLTLSAVDPNRVQGGGGGDRSGGLKGGGQAPPGDPVGGVSLFDAVEKQLGLKLEFHKRPEPVFVIDHIEEKPTDN